LSAIPPRKGFTKMPIIGIEQNTKPILFAVIPNCLPIKDLKEVVKNN